jgi:hypothetical protein
MGLIDSPLWNRCRAEEETSAHVLCECEAVASLGRTSLGSFFLDPEDIISLSLGAIWNFYQMIEQWKGNGSNLSPWISNEQSHGSEDILTSFQAIVRLTVSIFLSVKETVIVKWYKPKKWIKFSELENFNKTQWIVLSGVHDRFQLTQGFTKCYSTSFNYTEYFKADVDYSIRKINVNLCYYMQ